MIQYMPFETELQATDFLYSGDFFARIPADQDKDEFATIPVEIAGHVDPPEPQTRTYPGCPAQCVDMTACLIGTTDDFWDKLTKKAQDRLECEYQEAVYDRESDRDEAAQEHAAECREDR